MIIDNRHSIFLWLAFTVCFTTISIDFHKALLNVINLHNVTNKNITITVIHCLNHEKQCSLGQNTFVLKPFSWLHLNVNSLGHPCKGSRYIKALYASEELSGKKVSIHLYNGNNKNITCYIRDDLPNFDLLQVSFDKAINTDSDFYKECMTDTVIKYTNGIHYKVFIHPTEPSTFINFIRKLYQKYYPDNPNLTVKPDLKPRIPKKIHQIWLGPKSIRTEYKEYQKKWQNMHPTWEYKLWTDKDLKNLKLQNRDLIDKALNYAAKADLLRMEILEREGGVYIDIDTEPLEPIDNLVHTFDFFALLNGPRHGLLLVDVYFIGAIPHHPVIQQTIENARYYINNKPYYYQNFGHNRNVKDTMTTGSYAFSRAVFEKADQNSNRDIILPFYYFGMYTMNPFSYAIHYQKLEWLQGNK